MLNETKNENTFYYIGISTECAKIGLFYITAAVPKRYPSDIIVFILCRFLFEN